MAGLNTRIVQPVSVDENGNPVMGGLFSAGKELPYYPQLTERPVQGTKRSRGDYPPAYNSVGEPWPGAYDQTVAQNGRVVDKYTVATNPPSEFSRAYVDSIGAPGANQGTGPSVATDAIAAALMPPSQVQPSAPAGPSPVMIPAPTIAASDPWEGMRIPSGNEPVMRPGLVTGTPGGGSLPLDTPTGYTPQTPRQLATGMGGLRDNQFDTYTKRQQQIASTGGFTLNSGATVKVGDKVRATDGSIKTVMSDGTFR